jgi:hypothetical protein
LEVGFRGFWDSTRSEAFTGARFLAPLAFGEGYIVGAPVSGSLVQFAHSADAEMQVESVLEMGDSAPLMDAAAVFGGSDLWVWDSLQGRVASISGGVPEAVRLSTGAPLTIAQLADFDSTTVVADWTNDSLKLLAQSGELRVQLLDQVADSVKTTAADISDLLAITVGVRSYLVSASHQENGISVYEHTGDHLIAVDHIGAKDGLWVDGIQKLATCEVGSESFVLAASARAGVIASLRLNVHGVFFIADILTDTRNSRFDGVVDMSMIEWNGRDFLLAGGQDAGLSVIEVLPGGVLFHHTSLAQTTDWDIGAITQIEAQVIGTTARIYLTGSGAPGVAELDVDLSTLGARQTGTAGNDTLRGDGRDDILVGGAGNDRLRGGGGDDVLIAGAGQDALSGEGGANVFVFTADGQRDKITDFHLGVDRLDLSGWGRLYDHTSITIDPTSSGAILTWREEILDVFSADGQPLPVDLWGADDFIF